MSPIDKIRKGILSNDMEQVTQGFKLLTGEEIRPEEGKPEEPNTEKAVQSPVQMRSKDLDFSTTEEPDESKREPVKAKKNQFVDDGTEALVSEDPELKTPEIALTERRPPANLVEVVCHVCGTTEQINKKYKVGQFHRCGKCVG
jgi:hypothetical protein